MAADSDIEWTDATWPVTDGCEDESPGCLNCYAKRFVHRGLHARTRGLTVMGARGPKWTGEVRPVPAEVLAWPLSWKKPKRIFVNSQSDLFHEDVPDEHIAAVFGIMAACPQHTFQVLTKRAERLPRWFAWLERHVDGGNLDDRWFACHQAAATACPDYEPATAGRDDYDNWPLPNVWIGVSVESQKYADERVPHLLQTPAAIRFLSCEPLLGPVDLRHALRGLCRACGKHPHEAPAMGWTNDGYNTRCPSCLGEPGAIGCGVDWVIVGGESGPNARPMHPDWARSLRDQCVTAGTPFHFKQWGEWAEIPYDRESPPGDRPRERYVNLAGGHGFHGEHVVRIRTARKKINGRELDGRTWDEMPVARIA